MQAPEVVTPTVEGGEGSSFFESLPPYAKALVVTAGVVTAGTAAWYLYSLFTRGSFVPYPDQPDGAVRLFCEELLEERDMANQGRWAEAKLWKTVAQANKSDDYETYINCLQDLHLFYVLNNKPDKALNCVNRQLKCIKRRLKANDMPDYPIVSDYLKCLQNKADQCERAGKSMLAAHCLDKGVKIEAIYLGKKVEGFETKVDWLKLPAPRVLHLSLVDVLRPSKPQQTPEDAQNTINQVLQINDYADAHLPKDNSERSMDEIQHMANLSGALAALYMNDQKPNKALAWLKNAESHFAALSELPSVILQRTLLLRHLAECHAQLGDMDTSAEHMENCVNGLVQIIGDSKEEEAVMMLIDCTSFLINLLAAQRNGTAGEKIQHYREMIMTKYPAQLEKLMQQQSDDQEGVH